MAFDLNFGSVTNLFSDLFLMSVQNADDQSKLPCKILELQEVETQGIPTMPLDNNSFISDTIYKQPLQLQLSVFVYGNQVNTFESLLVKAQNSKKGFIINGVYKSYPNMRLSEKSSSENSNMVGGKVFSLAFQETLFVQSYNEVMTPEQVKKYQDSVKVEGGTKISNKQSGAYAIGGGLIS